jgi:lipid A 4'-phosphatase
VQARELGIVIGVGIALCALALILPAIDPAIDLAVSSRFHVGPGAFALQQSPFWTGLREAFLKTFTAWYVLVAAATLFALRTGAVIGRWRGDHWLYLAIASIVGPWLLVNVWLKEYWGRWRPIFLQEFGGAERYSLPFDWSGSCPRNCAFVSGEVASMVMLFVGVALISRHWRPVFYALAALLGAIVSFIRIGMGGHFLTDTLAAAGLMVVLAVVVLVICRSLGMRV